MAAALERGEGQNDGNFDDEREAVIKSFTRNTLHTMTKSSRWGVYIVQSETVPDYFRIGVSGINGAIWDRLGMHRGGPPKSRKNPPNWTELNRPWNVVWLAQIEAATEAAILGAEHYLCGQFSQRYPFVSESGFKAVDGAIGEIVKTAEAALPTIEAIVSVQTEPLFKKQPKGERWMAPASQG